MQGTIHFNNITKSFQNRSGITSTVLDNFCYTARRGLNCLLGATGCGKTTLLRLAAGLVQPDKGTATLDGKAPQQSQVGYISQHDTLLPWANILENVALPLRINGVDRTTRLSNAMQALKRVGLEHALHYKPQECSGGMKQRVMLARQLLFPSSFWLMDEPFSSLDLPTRRGLQQLLRQLQAEKELTILMVTHDVDEAINTADRIAMMPQGNKKGITMFDPTMNAEDLRKEIVNVFLESSAV